MARPELTTFQMTNLLQEYGRRLTRLEKIVRNLIVDDDSGSFQSVVTSQTGGKGSVSASWSANKSGSLPIGARTSATGSESLSLPEAEGLPGA